MNLTVDQRIRMYIGELVVQITAQQVELEQVKAENAQLKAQIGENGEASKQEFGRPVDNGGATPV